MSDESIEAAAQDSTAPAAASEAAATPAAQPAQPAAANGDPLAALADAQEQAGKDKPLAQGDSVFAPPADPAKDKGDDAAPEKTEEPEPEPAPDPYPDVKLPDGFVVDDKQMGQYKEIAAKAKVAPEAFQELVSAYAENEQARTRQEADFIAKTNADWVGEISRHPEFGGAKLEETRNNVSTLVRKFGSEKLLLEMNRMSVGNWPELYYMLARIHRAGFGEDRAPAGGATVGDPKRETLSGMFPGV
jgi:hypothetical protein